MGKNSHIEWTHHTFNPWWGCAKVSPACKHCYAEAITNRFGGAKWGVKGERRFFGVEHWNEPLKWNKEAERDGIRYRVFCASMSDVYEDRADLAKERDKLWSLIEKTPALDWLVLTKRPENVQRLSPYGDKWPNNVWLGTSVENQEWADKRLPLINTVPAKIRFLSCEPLLGPIDLSALVKKKSIHWIIAGGESGPGSRPMSPEWVRGLRDFSAKRDIAFHFKQWGHWAPVSNKSKKKPTNFNFENSGFEMISLGKAISGRKLDGRTHDEFPDPAA
jgi:protein gp37